MTLVVGAKCKDGVVLVADKKVVESGDITSQNKIIMLPSVWAGFSGAGLTDLFSKFISRNFINIEERKKKIIAEMIAKNPKVTQEEINSVDTPYIYVNQFVEDCEGILMGMKNDYQDITQKYPSSLGILLAFRAGTEAELHYLDIDGCLDSPRNTFMAIGSGSPYAQTFLKEIWNENITMEQMAKLVYFIIRHIETSKLDNNVGEGVQAFFVPKIDERWKQIVQNGTTNGKLTEEEEKELEKYTILLDNDLAKRYPNIDNEVNDFRRNFSELRKKL